jgi:hypothetical protein
MDRRAIKLEGVRCGDKVSCPRPTPKGGREICIYVGIVPGTENKPLPDCVVIRPNGRRKRWPLWRIRLYVDNELRARFAREMEELDVHGDIVYDDL